MPIDDRPFDQRYTDPATTRLPPSPTPRVSGWITDPDEPSGFRWERDLTASGSVTQMLPTVAPVGRVDYQGAVDWAWPPDQDDYDTGDLIDPNAADPTPAEIADPDHPDHVDPWTPG